MVAQKRTNRNSDTVTIRNAFNNLLHEYQMDDKFKEKQLIASWAKLMGKPIAVRTSKLYFRDKKLFVHLNSGPLKSELHHSKKKIIEILQKECGENVLEDVVFL